MSGNFNIKLTLNLLCETTKLNQYTRINNYRQFKLPNILPVTRQVDPLRIRENDMI